MTSVYQDFDNETFIINNIKLRVAPTDVTLFSDNAVYETTFLRSKAVFSYRSKHAREKVILTLPISVSVTPATNDENAIYSREDGLRLLSQLTNYPFCFVKSSRIQSYVAPLGGISSTGFMMFGVQQLSIVQDMAMPDVLFLEVHLAFHNFTPTIRDFKFRDYGDETKEYPVESEMFNSAFTELETNVDDVNELLKSLLALVDEERKSGSAYIDGGLPYGTTVLLAPRISDTEENAELTSPVEYGSLLHETKTVTVTASDGTPGFTAAFLSDVTSENTDPIPTQKKELKIAWTAPTDLSFGGVAALQSIKITRTNKIARQYISAHKHPILQYMGRQSATVEMNFKVNTGAVYNENLTSIIAAYSHLGNILDFNAMTYPEASAYNCLKLRSIAAQAIGITNIIPNQKYVTSSSNEQGVESLSLTFIENDMEEFMKISTPIDGRSTLSNSSSSVFKDKVVIAYLDKIAATSGGIISSPLFNKDVGFFSRTSSTYGPIFESILNNMKTLMHGVTSDFIGGRVSEGVELTFNSDGKNVTTSTLINNVSQHGISDSLLWSRDVPRLAKALSDLMKQRLELKNKTSEERAEMAKNSAVMIARNANQEVVEFRPAANFKQSGVPDSATGAIFMELQKLSNMGDAAAKAALDSSKVGVENISNASTMKYTGYNFKEFNLSVLHSEGGGADATYFIAPEYHLTSTDMLAAYKMVDESFKKEIDDALAGTSDLQEGNMSAQYNFLAPALVKQDLDEQGYTAEEETSFHIDAMGNRTEGVDSSEYQGTAGGNYGLVTGGGAVGKVTDWNSYTGLDADQQRVKKAIIDAVTQSSRIEDKDKPSWIAYLVQLAGKESQLRTTAKSPTGPLGPFQFTAATGRAYGLATPEARRDPTKATNAAIALLSAIKAKYVPKGFTNWVDFYFGFNLGDAPGENLLNAVKNGKELGDITKTQILHQSISGITGSLPKAQIARAYYNHMVAMFAPMNKHMQTGQATRVEAPKETKKEEHAVKKEATKLVTRSREDIQRDFVKVEFVEEVKGSTVISAHQFYVKINGKKCLVQVDGIEAPWLEVENAQMTVKWANNRRATYTVAAQLHARTCWTHFSRIAKGGLYVRKDVRDVGTGKAFKTDVYSMTYRNVAQDLVGAGLAFPIVNGKYANIEGNGPLTRDKTLKRPNAAYNEMMSYAQKYANGDKTISPTKFSQGDSLKFIDDKSSVHALIQKENAAKLPPSSVPKVTTNTWLPFASGRGQVISEFGKYRTKAANGVSREGYHFGIDSTPADGGKEQFSPAEGVVRKAGWGSGGAGNSVQIWHDKIGFTTQYFHLSQMAVNVGDRVSKGTKVGVIGNSGLGYAAGRGVHSHYQVGLGDAAVGSLLHPFMTTALGEIPAVTAKGPGALQSHATKFINKNAHMGIRDSKAVDLRHDWKSRGKVWSGEGLGNDKFNGDSKSWYDPLLGTIDAITGEGQVNNTKNATSNPSSRGIAYEHSVFNETEIANRQISNMLYPYLQGLNYIFPVVKAYITVGSDNEDMILRNEIRLNYYFELDGVAGFQLVCNNDDNPVDILRMSIANPSFLVSDNYSVTGKYLTTNMTSVYGPDEIEWIADRIKIKSGTKLHIRVGYTNNPNDLATVFNGIVTEVSGEKGSTLDLVCEGFGRELLATQINPTKPEAAGGEWHNSSTALIFSKALLQDGIAHFGTRSNFTNTMLAWLTPFSDLKEDDKTDPEAKRMITRFNANPFSDAAGLGVFFTEGNIRQRLFTNIYAAEVDVLHPNFASRLGTYLTNLLSTTEKSGYFYIFEGQTPWEACKEMEYRHPGTKVKPLMYGDRMTMFFGLKEQMYISNDLDSNFMSSVVSDESETLTVEYLKERHKRFDLVTRFHIATSGNNIISNGLTLNSSFATGVDVLFFEDDHDRVEQKPDGLDSFRMSLDDNLNYWEYRYKTVSMPGTHGKYSSFMYGTTELRRQAETMYSGRITMLGNPHIKAGDYMFIDDDLKKMTGVIKVREVIHHFTSDGYVTEITPGLYIEASNFYYTTLFLKLGLTAQTAIAFSSFSTDSAALSNQDFNVFYESVLSNTNNSMLSNFVESSKLMMYNTGGVPIAAGALISISAYTSIKTLHSLGLNAKNTRAAYTFGADAYGGISSIMKISAQHAKFRMDLAKTSNNGKKVITAFEKLKQSSKIVKGVATLTRGGVWTATKVFMMLSKLRRAMSLGMLILSRHPIGAIATIVGTFICSYVMGLIQESMLTRQPLLLYPINYLGRPYTAGISGFSINSWLESKMNNYERNTKYIAKAATELAITRPGTMLGSVSAFFSGSSSSSNNLGALVTVQDQSKDQSKDLTKK